MEEEHEASRQLSSLSSKRSIIKPSVSRQAYSTNYHQRLFPLAHSMALPEGGSFELQLEVEGGELKAIGDASFAHFARPNMNINVMCIHQIHGFLDGPGTKPATLLVLRFDLGTRSKGRRFDFFSPSLRFRKSSESKPGRDVWVEDLFEPDAVYMSEVQSKKTHKSSLQPSFNVKAPAPFDVISAGLTWTDENSEEWTETYRYTLQATLTSDAIHGMHNRNDGIYWTAEVEDSRAKKSAGINKFQVGMLVGREDEGDFELVINIKEGAFDIWDEVKELWKTVRGKDTRTKVVSISPNTARTTQKVPKTVDLNHLRRLENDDRAILKGLTFVGAPELLQPASRAKLT